MARMLDGMERLLRGEVPPPAAAVRAGRLEARARVRSAGRTVGLVECDVVADGDKVAAHAVSTCMILRGAAAEGR
jgi:hypothetical protein